MKTISFETKSTLCALQQSDKDNEVMPILQTDPVDRIRDLNDTQPFLNPALQSIHQNVSAKSSILVGGK